MGAIISPGTLSTYEKSLTPPRLPSSYYGTKIARLGSGTYGTVFKYSGGPKGDVAVKTILIDEKAIDATTLREVSTLMRLNHPNVIPLLDLVMSDTKISLIMPAARMDLKKFIDEKKHNILPIRQSPEETDKFVAYQIISGVNYCLARGVIHRDIKPQNILVYGDGTVKLTDFGLSISIMHTSNSTSSDIYTLWYRPPEVLFGGIYGEPADIWALGCTLYELYTERALFQADNGFELALLYGKEFGPLDVAWPEIYLLPKWDVYHSRPRSANPPLNKITDVVIYQMIRGMVDLRPYARTPLQTVLETPYFDSVRRPSEDTRAHSYIKILGLRSQHPSLKILQPTRVNEKSLRILFEWLLTLSRTYKLKEQSFFLTQVLLRKYLEKRIVVLSELQMYGCACLNIAAKIVEIDAPELAGLVRMSDKAFTEGRLVRALNDIVSTLNFDLSFTTSVDFLIVFASMGSYPSQVEILSYDTLKLLVLSSVFYGKYTSKELALGCLFFACIYTSYTFKHKHHLTPKISQLMNEIVSYQVSTEEELVVKEFNPPFSQVQECVKNRITKN